MKVAASGDPIPARPVHSSLSIQPAPTYGALLHRGRNSDIFAARIDARDVVVKRPRTARATERLLREADLLRNIDAEHVVRLIALIHHADLPALVLPRYDGSLGDASPELIEARGGITTVASSIARALTAIHDKNALHRDVHPGNVLHAADRPFVLSDLGHARAPGQSPLTPEGHTVGTVGYIAPEVLRGDAASQASDIYAFAVTLFELVTAQRPFEHPDPLVEMTRTQREHPFPLRTYISRLRAPRALEELIDAALAPNPASRPSVEDFIT